MIETNHLILKKKKSTYIHITVLQRQKILILTRRTYNEIDMFQV